MSDAGCGHLLARLRDLDCEAVYIRCEGCDDAQQRSPRLRSLGFLPLKHYAGGAALFYFDIYDYKLPPDWLNRRFRANPEMWNKARW